MFLVKERFQIGEIIMNNIPKGYKQTKVGVIPEEWKVMRLGEVSKITMGQSPKSKSYNENQKGIPLIQGNADCKNRKTSPRLYTTEITKICNIGDIIMTVRAPVGAISNSLHNACIGRGVCAIKFINNNNYLYHFLVNYENKWEKYSQGSTFTAVNNSDIKNLKIPLPPLKEQQKIAEILTTWDSVISKQEELIKTKEKLKKGLMQKLLSGKVRFKEFSDEWKEVRLGEIATLKNGYPFKSIDYIEKGKYKIITIGNVLNGKLDLNKVKYIEKLPKNIQQHHILKKKDILISMTGNVGRVCLVNENNCLLNQRVGYLNTKKDNNFIYSVLNTKKFEKKMIGLGQGGAQPNISKKDIENFKILIPKTLQEQQKIANVLSTADKEIELLKKELEELKKQKKGLMQRLLSGEVRVKV